MTFSPLLVGDDVDKLVLFVINHFLFNEPITALTNVDAQDRLNHQTVHLFLLLSGDQDRAELPVDELQAQFYRQQQEILEIELRFQLLLLQLALVALLQLPVPPRQRVRTRVQHQQQRESRNQQEHQRTHHQLLGKGQHRLNWVLQLQLAFHPAGNEGTQILFQYWVKPIQRQGLDRFAVHAYRRISRIDYRIIWLTVNYPQKADTPKYLSCPANNLTKGRGQFYWVWGCELMSISFDIF